jgi:hypothetical protein
MAALVTRAQEGRVWQWVNNGVSMLFTARLYYILILFNVAKQMSPRRFAADSDDVL